MFPDVNDQLAVIRRGVAEIFPENELVEKLKRSKAQNRPLRIKYGIDPTAPDVHLGHCVPIRKLRHFQDLGHQAVLIIGDYTAMVGDPSGKDETRRMLSHDEVLAKAKTYIQQIGKMLDMSKVEIRHNGDWFSKMTFQDVVRLAAKITVSRILERDDFAKRLAEQAPISLHECLYALMQAHDSVMIRADVELGGTEQKFNLALGRDLQRDAGQEPQICLTFPILVGTDGVRRMGKSLGNYIGIAEPPKEMFGKLMSIPDAAMRMYFELATDLPMADVGRLLAGHPRDAKVALAKAIVARYHSAEAAEREAAEFDRVFSQRLMPQSIPSVEIPAAELKDGKLAIVKLITRCGFAKSNSEARRLIVQGGVTLDGQTVTDAQADVPVKSDIVLQVGKRRFARIRVE